MTFNGTKLPLTRFRSLGLLAMASAAGMLSGCLDRPVGETKPETNNIFVKQNPSGGIDKIDILFMIDNSLSMGDKQAVLSAAVPQLLTRLTNPDCVSEDGNAAPQTMGNPTEDCPAGLQREFAPVKDIHIGVVTSSLGDFSGDVCPETFAEGKAGYPDQNDRGWLLGALGRVDAVEGVGGQVPDFFSWTKENAAAYGTAINDKTAEFRNFVTAAGEIGCGLEMALESWYRFLVDPKPPIQIVQKDPNGEVMRDYGATEGDQVILALRKSFLRSDSLVAVVMLADENDCSLKDSRSFSWVPAKQKDNWRMWGGSSICASDPNNEWCFSCMLAGVDPSISAECMQKDPECVSTNTSKQLPLAQDQLGLRCLDMKKRFGFDFLFPVTRYANALTKPKICPDQTYGDLDCECTAAKEKGVPCSPGESVDNDLYRNLTGEIPSGPDREDASAVFFAGIVGVPWQDLAIDAVNEAVASGRQADLEYKLASALDWDLFTPADNGTPPKDPLMHETWEVRTGVHPITNEPLAGPDSPRNANSINGHEWNTEGADLQFACTFSLELSITDGVTPATRDCASEAVYCAGRADADLEKCKRQYVGCSCSKAADATTPYTQNSPLCQAASGYSSKQVAAKAYPGIRELQALRAFYEQTNTDNTIVASICPKDLTFANQKKAGYGYNPAVASLVNRLKEKLGGTCLPRPLTVDPETNEVPCSIVEVINKNKDAAWCNCADKGREDIEPSLAKAIRNTIERESLCGGKDQLDCSEYCFCGLPELNASTTDGVACLTRANIEKSAAKPGYCYVDPEQAPAELVDGEKSIVASCPASQKRLIRIVGGDDVGVPRAPAPGQVFIACSGSAYSGK